jgi:hypothetical protein
MRLRMTHVRPVIVKAPGLDFVEPTAVVLLGLPAPLLLAVRKGACEPAY